MIPIGLRRGMEGERDGYTRDFECGMYKYGMSNYFENMKVASMTRIVCMCICGDVSWGCRDRTKF
jgi:hypothetical protein